MVRRTTKVLILFLITLGTIEALAQRPSAASPTYRSPRPRVSEYVVLSDSERTGKLPEQQYLAEVILNIQSTQRASNYFQKRGSNRFSEFLGFSLAISALLSGLSVAIQGANQSSKSTPRKRKVGFALACLTAVASSAGFYINYESERFVKGNNDKYIGYSLDLNDAITKFYISFREGGYSDETITDPVVMQSLVSLDRKTQQELSEIAQFYNQEYGINTGAPSNLQ